MIISIYCPSLHECSSSSTVARSMHHFFHCLTLLLPPITLAQHETQQFSFHRRHRYASMHQQPLCGSVFGKHYSLVARPNRSPFASTSTTTPCLPLLQLLLPITCACGHTHTQYKVQRSHITSLVPPHRHPLLSLTSTHVHPKKSYYIYIYNDDVNAYFHRNNLSLI